jgi:hypothetical protein
MLAESGWKPFQANLSKNEIFKTLSYLRNVGSTFILSGLRTNPSFYERNLRLQISSHPSEKASKIDTYRGLNFSIK